VVSNVAKFSMRCNRLRALLGAGMQQHPISSLRPPACRRVLGGEWYTTGLERSKFELGSYEF